MFFSFGLVFIRQFELTNFKNNLINKHYIRQKQNYVSSVVRSRLYTSHLSIIKYILLNISYVTTYVFNNCALFCY